MATTYHNRVFVDTNLLINEFFHRVKHIQEKDTSEAAHALAYIRKQPGVSLYIASFSVIQLISTLSKKGALRRFGLLITRAEIDSEVARILSAYKLIRFEEKDIALALKQPYTDLEDACQYQLCLKGGCYYLITNDKSGFRSLTDVRVVLPRRARSILF